MSNNTSLEIRDIEKRELNHIVSSYAENKNELLERTPELIDWNMFRRKISPELVDVLQLQYKRLKKQGLTIKTQEKHMTKGWESGKEYYLQYENRYQDGPDSVEVMQKKVKRIREYYRENQMISRIKDKVWFTYFVRKDSGEVRKISSEDMDFMQWGAYGREQEYPLEQNFTQEKHAQWIWNIFCWVFIGIASGIFCYLIYGFLWVSFPDLSEEFMISRSLIGAAGLDIVLRARLIMAHLRFRGRTKSNKVLQRIRQQWPDFCMDKFAAMTGSRVKRIFYADSMEDIGDFVSCDFSDFLKDYANVVDCETMDFRFNGISQDENYEYINVRQKVLLTGDLGTKIKRKKLTVKLTYMRSKDSIMYTDFYHDWYISEIKTRGKWFGAKTV